MYLIGKQHAAPFGTGHVAGLVALWSAFGVLAAMQVWLRPAPHAGLPFLAFLHVPHWTSWAGFSLIVWEVHRRIAPRSPAATAALHVPLGAIIIAGHAAVVAWWDVLLLRGDYPVTVAGIFLTHLRSSADTEALGYLVVVAGAILIVGRPHRSSAVRTSVVAHDSKTARPALPVRVGTATDLIPLEEIAYLEAANNYARVHTADRRLAVRQSLASLVRALDGRFVRVHRSIVVNVDHIARLHSAGRWRKFVILRHGPELRASQDGWRRVQDRVRPSPSP